MAGIDVGGGGRGGRKSLDSEINMIPMIDLLMVTVSFLLITAVWSSMSRLDASAQTPGDPNAPPPPPLVEPRVHLDVRDGEHFKIAVKLGDQTSYSVDVDDPALPSGTQGEAKEHRALSAALANVWRMYGMHRTDPKYDVLVLHASDDVRYDELVRVMDSAMSVKRADGRDAAFRVTFATK